jgi:uncharacterized iron-regulated membrane protein
MPWSRPRASGGDGRVRFVGFPQRPDQPFRVGLRAPGDGERAPHRHAFIDPVTGGHRGAGSATYTIGETILAWQHALHAGQGLGWGWKAAVFVSARLPPLF